MKGKADEPASTAWRNKDHCRGYINKKLVQSQEDLPTRSSKCSNIRMTTMDDQRRWVGHYFHRWRCKMTAPSSWQCECHYFGNCKLYN